MEEQLIPNYIPVKAYLYADTMELTDAGSYRRPTIKNLSNGRYIDLSTGETKEYASLSNVKSDNVKSVKNSLRKLRRLIVNNFHGGKNELWITLTFEKNVTDPNEVYSRFKTFWRRLKRQTYGKTLEYISVLEPQASGRWHLHVLLKRTDGKMLRISNDNMEELWGQGFTKTKRLKKSDNVANYLMAYLTDLDVNATDGTESKSKSVTKGERLKLYPSHTNIYRASRGIVRPVVDHGEKGDLLEHYGYGRRAIPEKAYHRPYTMSDGRVGAINTEIYTKKATDSNRQVRYQLPDTPNDRYTSGVKKKNTITTNRKSNC